MATEKRLIDADKLFSAIRDDAEIRGTTYARVKEHIFNAEDEVVHGRWIGVPSGPFGIPAFKCSVCESKAPIEERFPETGGRYTCYKLTPYCPECGAKMDLEV